MGKVKDIVGQKFGRLTVVGVDSKDDRGKHYVCLCECGNKTIVLY